MVKNWSFEDGFEGPAGQQVGKDWDSFVLSGTVNFYSGYNLYGANVEKIHGKDSQVLKSDDPFDAGVYQIITGLVANQWYSVVVYILSIFETSATPNPSAFDGLIVKQIGVDPAGGRNPAAATIVWGPAIDKNMDRNTWGQRLIFQAQASTATLFIRVQCLQGVSNRTAYDNQVFIDGAQVRVSAIAQATVPQGPQDTTFTVSWKAVVPGAYSPEATVLDFDVQYKDGGGLWQDWLQHAATGSATFTKGSPGHTYTFRVRAWTRYTGTDQQGSFCEIYGPWAESASVQVGRVVELTALDNRGQPVMGILAQLLNASGAVVATATSDSSGRAYLAPGSDATYDVSIAPSWYLPPVAIRGIAVNEGIQPVVMVLRPPDDLVADGSFEETALGSVPPNWTTVGSGIEVSSYYSHGGSNSLWLATSYNESGVCIRQTFTLNSVYQPALSLFYKLLPGQQGMEKVLLITLYNSELQAVAATSLQSQQPTDWQRLSLVATTDDVPYQGELTIEICLQDPPGSPETFAETTFAYLDDISLGRSSGGPMRVFVPKLHKSAPR
ncbi:MAG: fibronectin type III domain-containing protein [Anaerolineae bacterium]